MGAYLIKGGSMIVSLFTLPAYIHFFKDQTILGIWFTILSVLNWVLMFDLGLGNGLRNKLTLALAEGNNEKAQRYISATYFATLCLVCFASLLSWILIPIIDWNNVLNVDYSLVSSKILIKSVQIVFVGIMFQFLLKLITSILYALQKSALVNFLILFSNVIILIFIYIMPPASLEENLITMSWLNVFSVNIPLFITTLLLFNTNLRTMYPKATLVSRRYVIEVMKVGGALLWLQLVFMVISSTNEFLISYLTSPDAVVEYQAYFKIFNTIASIFALALSPIWSAVTKAQAEFNFTWIEKLYRILLYTAVGAFFCEVAVIPFLQIIIDLWLGSNEIIVNPFYSFVFAISGSVFIFHSVNTSIGNGLSFFRIQMIWMTVAAIVNIPLAFVLVRLLGGWIGVVVANVIVLIPYEIMAPLYTMKYLKNKESEQ